MDNNNHHVGSDWNLPCVLLPLCAILQVKPKQKTKDLTVIFHLDTIIITVIIILLTRDLRAKRKGLEKRAGVRWDRILFLSY